ncbi:MAG: hypothetical protein IT279_08270 [Ignavibacteriaceae bacterium]|nr:hypothetical protein [Ignavibacteriaceae bacterium]
MDKYRGGGLTAENDWSGAQARKIIHCPLIPDPPPDDENKPHPQPFSLKMEKGARKTL